MTIVDVTVSIAISSEKSSLAYAKNSTKDLCKKNRRRKEDVWEKYCHLPASGDELKVVRDKVYLEGAICRHAWKTRR